MLGLVLGGGAAWGLAHVGVVEVLREEGLSIDLIVGTSVGAIIGSFVAAGIETDAIKEMVSDITWADLGRLTMPHLGFADSSEIEAMVEEMIGKGRTFDELEIPLKVIATDVIRGEQVVLDWGPLAPAIRASASIPVLFTPVELEDILLVDGGVVNNLPVDVAIDAGATKVIAVELAHPLPHEAPGNPAELGFICYTIMQKYGMSLRAEEADILLQPDFKGISSLDLSAHEELIQLGRDVATEQIAAIRNLV